MRVIAGSLKGRRLAPPTWDGLRPTSDKLRETLFNILAPRIQGARVFDGYAGTGALGIEAISRGAREVTFVESDKRAQALIAANLAHCGIGTGYTVLRARVEHAVENVPAASLDIVLLDPPYDIPAETLSAVIASFDTTLEATGVLVLEHARRHASPESAGGLRRVRQVTSGDSALSFYACPL
jgi:16S rRNA (guanine966-N2)-methyltransferase